MERRAQVLQMITQSKQPLSAAKIAASLHVSRQIIVGDVALLRAAGHSIIATPRGYMIENSQGIIHTIAVIHQKEAIEEELNLIVDYGGVVIDVIVEHPLYGEIKGNLQIRSRHDVAMFMKKSQEEKATPLSSLTGGVHLHTIAVENEGVYDLIVQALKEHGFLYEKDSQSL